MENKFIDLLLEKESVSQEKRTVTGIISSNIIDRDGEIVSADAIKKAMAAFMKNPVVIVYHKHKLDDGTPVVIGKVVRWWQDNGKTWAEIEFAKTQLAEEYWILYSQGFQKAFSIGFRSIKTETGYIDGKSVLTHTEIEVYEVSLVAVGANQEALTKALQDYFTKEIAAMESRIVKSITEQKEVPASVVKFFEGMESRIKEELEDQFDRLKLLLIDNNNPNGCGGDPLGDPDTPPVAAKQKTETKKIVNAIDNLLSKGSSNG